MSSRTGDAGTIDFVPAFQALTGNVPFPWQCELFRLLCAGDFPVSCDLPTGLGKTSVIPVWLIALAVNPAAVPRRLVYVVNRRTVVDQATREAEGIRNRLDALPALKASLQGLCALPTDIPLAVSTLRGQFADNAEWRSDPARAAIVIGTVDMIGSRLLFSGYGIGFRTKPLHAGFLGQDALLVHDEAHLEPAFQDLLIEIRNEQNRCGEVRTFRLMELSATSRGGGDVFELTAQEQSPPAEIPDPPTAPIHHVWRRLRAKKGIQLDAAKRTEVAKFIGETARRWRTSGKAVLVFVRAIDDVTAVQKILTDRKQGVPGDQVQVLTGTLRGLERDRLAECDPVFARFRPDPKVIPKQGTVYLVCTSAGEVGVDISADHMVCDLTTLDSMTQRLGRVNRRGGGQAEIDVVYESDPDPKPRSPAFEQARWATKAILDRLPECDWLDSANRTRREGSPLALRSLLQSAEADGNNQWETERLAAFAPRPSPLPLSDILFDSWSLTTIRDRLPGRPPVEPYLHGLSEWQPPETQVAWRTEVELRLEQCRPQDLLEDYPLKPHELLRDRSDRVFRQLAALAEEHPDHPAWLLDEDGTVEALSLRELADKDQKDRINHRTVLLPPNAGGLLIQDGQSRGMLAGSSPYESEYLRWYDVADEWFDKDQHRRRIRLLDDSALDERTQGMRLIRRVALPVDEDDAEATGRFWLWFERPSQADDTGSKSAQETVLWHVHSDGVSKNAALIAASLRLAPELQTAIKLAAKFHDLGKRRELWQRSIGNPNPRNWLAKSGRDESGRLMNPVDLTDYRHEFGSLLDVQEEAEFQALSDDLQDLVLHLIASHHGRGRPHFPVEEAFDPDPNGRDVAAIANEVPRRFARLQRRFGRWGLAYLESVLRAADYAASAATNKDQPQ